MNPLKEKLKNYQIILGSQSPRRKHLLAELELSFEVIVKNVDESFPPGLNPEMVAEYIAKKKAMAFSKELAIDKTLLITADSIVGVDERILGKPVNVEDACAMLKMISGRWHTVVTGVCISNKEKMVSFSTQTSVRFKNLSNTEILHYVEKYKPMDKAGAYGIQEWIGFIGVASIEGSYTNVMGLPLNELYEQLMIF